MKKIFILCYIVLFILLFLNNYCFGVDNNSVNYIDEYSENNDDDSITIINLYNVFYLIAFILVVIFLYLFLSHILRIK